MTSQSLYQSIFMLRRPEVAKFTDIIKHAMMLIKTIFKGPTKVKRIRKMQFKSSIQIKYQMLFLSVFPNIAKISAEIKGRFS